MLFVLLGIRGAPIGRGGASTQKELQPSANSANRGEVDLQNVTLQEVQLYIANHGEYSADQESPYLSVCLLSLSLSLQKVTKRNAYVQVVELQFDGDATVLASSFSLSLSCS